MCVICEFVCVDDVVLMFVCEYGVVEFDDGDVWYV